MKLKQAWLCWRQGFPNYCYNQNIKIEIIAIKPFCQMKPTLLPKTNRFSFEKS